MARGRRSLIVALVGLAEVALVATIALALAGASWAEQVPGGRLVAAGAAAALLLIAVIAMTILVSA